jgi:uncharacterized protein (DUF1778 family)
MTTLSHDTSSTRYDFRLQAAEKKAIEEAAALLGMSLTQFAKTTLIQRAREVARTHHTTTLSDRDRDTLLALLDADAAPNPRLSGAAARYRKFKKLLRSSR